MTLSGDRPVAPATERNSRPILDVLRHEFRTASSVLEIGSGTGQHAVAFARVLSHLTWQTSDLEANRPGIHLWLAEASLANVRPPLLLDVLTAALDDGPYDAVFSANTAHIMSLAEVEKMFALVGSVLPEHGVFCLYGPFREGGEFDADSNARFDATLRQTNSQMGIRDIEQLDRFAASGSMQRVREYAMPANNMLMVWQKGAPSDGHDNA